MKIARMLVIVFALVFSSLLTLAAQPADCNNIGGIYCNDGKCYTAPNNLSVGASVSCTIDSVQEIDVGLSNLNLANGFLYFATLTINSGAKLHFYNSEGITNQAHLIDPSNSGRGGRGSKTKYGKYGGDGGGGGLVGAGGQAGSRGKGPNSYGPTSGGNNLDSKPGAAIGIIAQTLTLNGELSVSAYGSGDSASDAGGDGPGGGGGGAGGAGGGLLVLSVRTFSGAGTINAIGANGGSGGDGGHKWLSRHSGGGGGGGGGGAGGVVYFNKTSGPSINVDRGAGGSRGSEGANAAANGHAGSNGKPGKTYLGNIWSIEENFSNIDLTAMDFDISLDLTKFWDYPETFRDNILDQARLSKSWMRGYPYHTIYEAEDYATCEGTISGAVCSDFFASTCPIRVGCSVSCSGTITAQEYCNKYNFEGDPTGCDSDTYCEQAMYCIPAIGAPDPVSCSSISGACSPGSYYKTACEYCTGTLNSDCSQPQLQYEAFCDDWNSYGCSWVLQADPVKVLEVKRKYAPVLFYADFIGSSDLKGIVDTKPPFKERNEIVNHYKGYSIGTMLVTETNITQHFYDQGNGPVKKIIQTVYDNDIFAPSEMIFVNKKIYGTDFTQRQKTIYDKKSLLMGYKGSKAKELFGVNPSYTNQIIGLEMYKGGQLTAKEEYTYGILDMESGDTRLFNFYTSSAKVGLKDAVTGGWVVVCDYGTSCSQKVEQEAYTGAPYSFVYEVNSDANDFSCLKSSRFLDTSNFITECDVELGRALPQKYMIVLKRTDRYFDSNEGNPDLDKRVYSEILEFDNFARPIKTRNFDGAIVNIRYDKRGNIYKKWYTNVTSEQWPSFSKAYDSFGILTEKNTSISKFPENFYYNDRFRLEKLVGKDDTESSPTLIYEYDLSLTPKKFVTKSKIRQGVYAEAIEFKNSNGLIMQKQEKVSGNDYLVKHVSYRNGSMWREYAPVIMTTSGNYVDESTIESTVSEYKEYYYADDPTRRIESIRFEDGNFKTFLYDSMDIPSSDLNFPRITVIEPNGAMSRYTFNLMDNVIKVEQGDYDAGTDTYSSTITKSEGILEDTVIDPLGRTITVIKDSVGNILQRQHFDTGTLINQYNYLMQLAQQVSAMGKTTSYKYKEGTNEVSSVILEK